MAAEWTPPAGALWIGTAHPFDLHEAYLCFRSPPFTAHPPARLSLTADSRYKLWVNGTFAGRGPARCYPAHQSVDTIDLDPFLVDGPNRLAVQVYQPGYSHFAYVHRGAAGLLAAVEVDGEPILLSDGRWRARRDPSFAAGVPRVSIYGTGVEKRDMAQADPWTDPAFDDGGWDPARPAARPGDAPWTGPTRRDVPFLLETIIRPQPIEFRRGPAVESTADPHLNLAAGWAASQAIPCEPAGPWMSLDLAAGQAFFALFDLGRDFTCQGRVIVDKAAGGEIVRLSYAETRRGGRLILSDPATYCRVRLTDETRLRPGAQTVEGFSLRGGRYLLLQIAAPTATTLRFRCEARLAAYPLVITRRPETADPELDRIITLCAETLQACLQETFVDGVWRESSQWLGDGLIQALTLDALSDDRRPVRRLLEMSVQGAYPDGMLPGVIPGDVHAYTIPRYGCLWVELLDFYQRAAGDDALVRALWPALGRLLGALQAHRVDGLLATPPGRRSFIDWAPNAAGEPHAVYNLHIVLALQRAAALADRLAQPEAAGWRADADDLQRRTAAVFSDGSGNWFDDPGRTTRSQLTHALAVLTGSARSSVRERLLDEIAARSLDPSDDHRPGDLVLASPFMHHYLFEALRQNGRGRQVVEIIRLRWGRWVRAGCPTAWENWNVDFPDGSQCHAFSAHPIYHLHQLNLTIHRPPTRSQTH